MDFSSFIKCVLKLLTLIYILNKDKVLNSNKSWDLKTQIPPNPILKYSVPNSTFVFAMLGRWGRSNSLEDPKINSWTYIYETMEPTPLKLSMQNTLGHVRVAHFHSKEGAFLRKIHFLYVWYGNFSWNYFFTSLSFFSLLPWKQTSRGGGMGGAEKKTQKFIIGSPSSSSSSPSPKQAIKLWSPLQLEKMLPLYMLIQQPLPASSPASLVLCNFHHWNPSLLPLQLTKHLCNSQNPWMMMQIRA